MLLAVLGHLSCGSSSQVTASSTLYENDFQKAEVGKVPEEFMVLEGAFSVAEEKGDKFLELPGTPLETFGVLFGPNESAGLGVKARIFGTSKGRRAPSFAVGLNGVGGFKLQMAPSKRALELYKGDQMLTNATVNWESGSWTFLQLEVRKAGEGEWKIDGKAWKQGDKEPGTPVLSYVEKTAPISGKASVWGAPYAGTPIRFDDLRVTKAEPRS